MASYKQRVARDLDGWIAAGQVAAEHRAAILDSIPDARRLDAAAALAWLGAVLLGVALVAFVGANWDGLPRLARFVLVLGVFGAAAGAAAWCAGTGRPITANVLLTFDALAFAAGLGLTGQIFDIAGDTRSALYASAVVAFALALAGRASGAAVAAIVLVGLADFGVSGLDPSMAWLIVAAPAATALAIHWGSAPLAHAAALGMIAAGAWLTGTIHPLAAGLLGVATGLAALATGGRQLAERGAAVGSVFYGWFAWAALGFFVIAGYAPHNVGVPHRLAWLLISGALIALGRNDRHAAVTAAGVLGMIGAIATLLVDLGLSLMTAAGVFLLAAVLAGLGGLALRRRGVL